MLYRQPVTHKTFAPRPTAETQYQWCGWGEDVKAALPKLRRRLTLDETVKCEDMHLIVPGRSDKDIHLNDNDVLEIRSLEYKEGDIERWSVMFKSELPLARPTATAISQRIPRLGTSLVMAETTAEVTKNLSRGVKMFPVKKENKVYRGDGITARISTLEINGEKHKSLTLIAEEPDQIRSLLASLKLRPHRNRNIVDVLSETKVAA